MILRFILAFFLFVCDLVYADSCALPDIKKLDQKSDIVFIGKVDRKLKDFSLFNNKYAIEVVTPIKGNAEGVITIWTANLSSCGVNFRINQEYVIFVKINNGRMITNLSSSWAVIEGNRHLTEELEKFYKIKLLNGK